MQSNRRFAAAVEEDCEEMIEGVRHLGSAPRLTFSRLSQVLARKDGDSEGVLASRLGSRRLPDRIRPGFSGIALIPCGDELTLRSERLWRGSD